MLATDEALEHGWTWDDLCIIAETNLHHWQERYAEVFAGTLTWDQWSTVYAAVRPFQQMTHTAPRDGTRITAADHGTLGPMIEDAVDAVMMLTIVALYGPGRHPFRRALGWLRWRFRPPGEAELLDDLGIVEDMGDRRPPDS